MALATITIVSVSCKKSSSTSTSSGTSTVVGTGVPDVYTKIYGATSITVDASYVYIKVTGAPDHKSVYYATTNSL